MNKNDTSKKPSSPKRLDYDPSLGSSYIRHHKAPMADEKAKFMPYYFQLNNFPDITPADKMIYTALISSINKNSASDNTTMITLEDIMARAGYRKTTVYKSLKHLKELGIIANYRYPSGLRGYKILRDFSTHQPEELGTPGLQYCPPREKRSPRFHMKIFYKLVCFPDLLVTDRLVYSALHNYAQMKEDKRTISITDASVAELLNISPNTVHESIWKMCGLGILSCSISGTPRTITLIRDFEDLQPEEIKYLKKCGLEPKLPPTDEAFGFDSEGKLTCLKNEKMTVISNIIKDGLGAFDTNRKDAIKGGAKDMENHLDKLNDCIHNLLRISALVKDSESITRTEEHLKKYRAERERCEEALIKLYKEGTPQKTKMRSTVLPPHNTLES